MFTCVPQLNLAIPMPDTWLIKSQRCLCTFQVGYTPGTGFNLSEMQQREDPISPCTPSVLCDPAYSRIKDAIVDIYAVNVKLKAMGLCTGNLPFEASGSKDSTV